MEFYHSALILTFDQVYLPPDTTLFLCIKDVFFHSHATVYLQGFLLFFDHHLTADGHFLRQTFTYEAIFTPAWCTVATSVQAHLENSVLIKGKNSFCSCCNTLRRHSEILSS